MNNVYFGYKPYVTLVCAVLNVVANCFEHIASRSHRSTIKHLKNKQQFCINSSKYQVCIYIYMYVYSK